MNDKPQADLWRALERIERKVNYLVEAVIATMAFAVGYSFYQSHLELGAGVAVAIGIGVGVAVALVYRRRWLKP